jgi:adenylate kinase family enzyme
VSARETVRRILVIGSSGAGKSTLAARIARETGLPLIHLDHAYWEPGWREPPKAQWRATVVRLCAGDTWVMDGNYAGTFDIRMPRAQVIVFLDIDRFTCLAGVTKRVLANWGSSRPDMGPDCPERFDPSFMRYIWNFPSKSRPQIIAAITTLGAHAEIVHVRSRREIDGVLARLSGPAKAHSD